MNRQLKIDRMPVFVSHYTKNTGYEKEAKNLIKSLEKHKLKYNIEEIESLGSWRLNSNYCAKQVQQMLIKYPTRSILRLDADAKVQRFPSLFLKKSFTPDIAACLWEDSLIKPKPEGELLGGTMYFANNKKVRALVDNWVKLCAIMQTSKNGDLLQKLIDADSSIIFKNMPLSYCKIFDKMPEIKYSVIEHFQASRRLKN
jgi:hypothetical protein